MSFEICIFPFWGQGHILPCVELCNHLTSRNITVTLIISSTLATSLRQHPLLRIIHFPSSPLSSPGPPPHDDLVPELETLLARNPTRPACAIVDVMMDWSAPAFAKLNIPTVAFFTSGACSAAMEFATWKAHPLNLKPGETRLLPGLPHDMALTHSDLQQRRHQPPPLHDGGPGRGPPHHGGGPGRGPPHGPPKLGDPPPWVEGVRETIALMINTCDDLERPFIDYIASHVKKPVWGVGPLLPEQYWNSTWFASPRPGCPVEPAVQCERREVIQWLDTKPRGSVLYVSFGTEVGPTLEEYQELAQALESCEEPFIWVIQPGSGRPGPPHMGAQTEKGIFLTGWMAELGIGV
ncbi:Scopoletin glucosyltransferase [Spatholobus suberectus]|nr:Scopoletin glucosyltransferase [Spatholobus suberectus]